jgi:hypothetical protein
VAVLLALVLVTVGMSVWELYGGPRWRTPVVVGACAVVAIAFFSQRVI